MTSRVRCIVVVSLASLLGAATTQPDLPGQLHAMVYGRIDPAGESFPEMVDPPLWPDTEHLLVGESHRQVIAILDSINAAPVRETDRDLRQRAILQHELWRLFDWTLAGDTPTTHDARIALRKKLASAIRHVALTPEQIRALPDNLAGSDAPKLSADEWLSLGNNGAQAIASVHLREFGGTSAFGVFLRHPDGVRAANAYVEQLAKVKFPLPRDDSRGTFLAAGSVPDFPAGTRLALLRRMMLIDRDGKLCAAPITQSVQVRTFVKMRPEPEPGDVTMAEFVLDRDAYVRGTGKALRAIDANEAFPIVFLTHSVDPIERAARHPGEDYNRPRPTLSTCIACHRDAGVLSMNCYTGVFAPPAAETNIAALGFDREISLTRTWKESQSTWGVLRGYWEATR